MTNICRDCVGLYVLRKVFKENKANFKTLSFLLKQKQKQTLSFHMTLTRRLFDYLTDERVLFW